MPVWNTGQSGPVKYPIIRTKSDRVDVEVIGPAEALDLETECGSGLCQWLAGDFLFHCHVAHHYVAGMWGYWRVYNTMQETGMQNDVMAPMRAMRAAIPPMAERGWGRVVNVSSTAGKRPSAFIAEYSVANAAELSLSRLFADRHAGEGVLVNAICPGPAKTELWMDAGGLLDQSAGLSGATTREEALEAAGAKRPIGRLAETGEIAATIVFLCSEQASYVAGAAWSVDGGTVQGII